MTNENELSQNVNKMCTFKAHSMWLFIEKTSEWINNSYFMTYVVHTCSTELNIRFQQLVFAKEETKMQIVILSRKFWGNCFVFHPPLMEPLSFL